MPRRLSLDEVRVRRPDIEIIDRCPGTSSLLCKCTSCGKVIEVTLSVLSNGWKQCKSCYLKERANMGAELKKKNGAFFEERARAIHGDTYDYSKVNYIDAFTKVEIICPIHGSFWQRPVNHLQGYRCSTCGYQLPSKSLQSNKEEFVAKARKVHGDTYTYDHFVYKSSKTKSYITCPIHGDFLQHPNGHLTGRGCPECGKRSKGEDFIRNYLIAHNINFDPQHKFPDCRDKRPLPFDFYLPDYNMCIEYQGEQHYDRNIQFMRNVSKYDYTVQHDKIKANYCKDNGIILEAIPYNVDLQARLDTLFGY